MRKKILIVITGSIAAYKALYLIRKLKEKDFFINVIMTKSAKKFITPLSVSSLTEKRVHEKLFDLTEETEMGHIKLSKMHDLIIVMPASANFMAKVSSGYADDLATTVLLASKTRVLFVPAMNINMLTNAITQRNIKYLQSLGYDFIFGNEGKLACGDYGLGRMSEPDDIVKYLDILFDKTKPLCYWLFLRNIEIGYGAFENFGSHTKGFTQSRMWMNCQGNVLCVRAHFHC